MKLYVYEDIVDILENLDSIDKKDFFFAVARAYPQVFVDVVINRMDRSGSCQNYPYCVMHNYVESIKACRSATGLGLAEAKRMVKDGGCKHWRYKKL